MVTFLKKASSLAPKKNAKFFLHQLLTGFETARSIKTVHASSLTKSEGMCPRYYALHDASGKKPKDEFLTTSERMTFQIGRDQERNIVKWFGEMGRAACHWRCVACNTRHDYQFMPAKCGTCGTKAVEPVEVRFESKVTGASAGVDMLLALGRPKLDIYEIKTMDKDQFSELKAPLAEHRLRTNLYCRIVEESGHPFADQINTDRAFILYVSKGGYGTADPDLKKAGFPDRFSPFKEFEIKRDDSQTDDISKRAMTVALYRNGSIGMPCGICPNAMVKRAAGCTRKLECFSGEYPPVFDWKAEELPSAHDQE